MNFHTGNRQTRNEQEIPGGYDMFWTAPSGFRSHPIAYGFKAFSLVGRGRIVPVKMVNGDGLNVVAYAVMGSDNARYVTIINRESGPNARDANVELDAGEEAASVETMMLTSPRNDCAALDGATLGGTEIRSDGAWRGSWSIQAATSERVTLSVPACAAIVVKAGAR